MDSTLTCSVCLSMAASHPSPTICSWATMLTEASSPWRPSASCLHTRSSTRRTSSSYGATMSVHPSTGSMAFLMSVSASESSTLIVVDYTRHMESISVKNMAAVSHFVKKKQDLWKS